MSKEIDQDYYQAAFPEQHPANDPRASGFYSSSGMTLLDYFAGQILASGVIDTEDDALTIGGCAEFIGITVEEYDSHKHWPIYRAKKAYEAAKAMMEVRKEIYE